MKAIKITISILLAMLASNSAFADVYTPVATDKFLIMLNSLFGQLGSFGASGNDSLIGMVSIITQVSLFLAGFLVAYIILTAVLGTAHDGEMLGKKHSSLWVPIRLCTAVSLIVPAFNGYAVIHKIVGAIIVMGVGMGDYAASSFMSKQSLTQIASASLTQPEPKNLAYNLFASYACLNTLKKYSKGGNAEILFGETDFGLTKEDGLKTTTYLFGNKTGSGNISTDACGKLEISKWQVPPIETNKGLASTLISASDATARMQVITKSNEAQTAILMSKMDTLASQLVDKEMPINPLAIEDAIGVYRQAVSKTASEQVLAMEQFAQLKKSVDQDGFIFLGAYYNKISKLVDLANSSTANVPVASGVTNFPVESLKDRWSTVFKYVAKTVDLSGSGVVNYGIGNEEGGSNDSWMSVIKKSLSNGFDLTIVLKKIFTSSSHLVFNENENMLMKVQRIGGWTMSIASAGFVGVGVASSTIGNAPGIGMFLCSSMLMIVTPLWIFGFTCLYLIPQIPNFIWIGCIASYLLLCVQSIIGSTLWVASMLCEGHEVMGQAQNAFKQLITLMLKPLLMVVGFCSSVVILQIFGTLVNSTFIDTWNLSQTDSGFLTYLGGMFAMPFIYTIFAITIIKTCFSIIHTQPDDIMQLIGGVGGSSGGHAKEMSGAVAGAGAVAGIAMVSKGLTNSVQSKMNSDRLAGQIKNKDNNGDKDMGSNGNAVSSERMQDEIIGKDKNSFEGTKKSSLLSKATNVMGGSNSEKGNYFLAGVKKLTNDRPELSLDKAVNSVMNKKINADYGSGVGRFVGQAGGGYTTGEAKQSLDLVKSASDKLDLDVGMQDFEVRGTVAKAVANSTKEFDNNSESSKNGGSMGLNDFFVKEINKSLPEESKFFEPSVNKEDLTMEGK